MKKDTLMFIINPAAGGYTDSVWQDVAVVMDRNNQEFAFYKTTCAGDAVKMVQNFITEGYRHFVAIGGDGTVSEVLNGFMLQNVVDYDELLLSAVSYGTGNDCVRYYGQSPVLEEALQGIISGTIHTQDVGLVHYYQDGEHRRKYFINSAGFGFDAQIIKATKSMTAKERGHKLTYLYSLLKCLLSSKKIPFTVCYEGGCISENVLSISVGNGKYTGGGMMQTPDAVNNDGFFDVAVFGDISKFTVIKNVNRLYNGSIKQAKESNMYHFRTSELTIEAPVETICEIDGELIGTGPYKIEIVRNALKVKL